MHARSREKGSVQTSNPFATISVTRKRSKKSFNGEWVRIDEYDPDVPVGTNVSQSDYCVISDIVGRENGFNGCTHVRNVPVDIGFTPSSGDSGATIDDLTTSWRVTGWQFTGNAARYSVAPHMNASSWAPQFPDIDWNSMVQSVGERLSGSMQARTNILVCLAEMGQTVGMLKNPFGLLKAKWRRSDLTLRQITKSGANVWLEYKYGWKNFFRDFAEISKVIEKTSAHVEYLQRTKDSWSPVRAQQTDEAPCSIAVPSIGATTNGIAVSVNSMTAKRRATFGLRILRGEAFRVLSRWAYAQQYTGATRVIEALWDLVPMSFVVDWFVDISRFAALNPILWNQHRLKNVGWSVRTTFEANMDISSRFLMDGPETELLSSLSLASQLVRETYERSAGFPANSGTAGVFGNFGSTALFDGASLILQRVL